MATICAGSGVACSAEALSPTQREACGCQAILQSGQCLPGPFLTVPTPAWLTNPCCPAVKRLP